MIRLWKILQSMFIVVGAELTYYHLTSIYNNGSKKVLCQPTFCLFKNRKRLLLLKRLLAIRSSNYVTLLWTKIKENAGFAAQKI